MRPRHLIGITIAVFALAVGAWLLTDASTAIQIRQAIGLAPAPVATAAKGKPICSQVIVPAGADCIPQHLAKLPPDPGEAGKKTIDGIDADKDGVRDDVQRFIYEQWPDSERSRRVLYEVAKVTLLEVHHGGDLGKRKRASSRRRSCALPPVIWALQNRKN